MKENTRKDKYLLKSGLITLFVSIACCLYSQTKEMEEMWRHQESTAKSNFNKPMYLNIDAEKITELLDGMPSFAMYKDNYFITGVPTNHSIDQYNADVKFQISVRQRLTKSVLPYNSFLILTYTQKSFWNLYEKSAPFADNNYNPGLAIEKPIIYNNQLRGMASLSMEHESNGKDTLDSRSCNYFVLSGSHFFNRYFSAQAKIWAGWLGKENKDLYKYRGYSLIAINYRSRNDKIWVSTIINPRENFWKVNTQLEVNLKFSSKDNQYFFLQWYNGYGESLLKYNQYTSMVRIGFCIKPTLRNLF